MPPRRDLTGQRFGALTVLRADGEVIWGGVQTAWLCRCDCGAELHVPQRRLTTKSPRQQMHACEDCRSTPCEICGKPVHLVARSKTCSPECRAERERRIQLAYYHAVRAHDPEQRARRLARAKSRWAALSPEKKLAVRRARAEAEDRVQKNAASREAYRRRVLTDPDYLAKRRSTSRKWAEDHPERAREIQREGARRRRKIMTEIEMLRAVEALKGDDSE